MKMAGSIGQVQGKAVGSAGQRALLPVPVHIQVDDVALQCSSQMHLAARRADNVAVAALLDFNQVILLVAVQGKTVNMWLIQAPGPTALPG